MRLFCGRPNCDRFSDAAMSGAVALALLGFAGLCFGAAGVGMSNNDLELSSTERGFGIFFGIAFGLCLLCFASCYAQDAYRDCRRSCDEGQGALPTGTETVEDTSGVASHYVSIS